MSHFPLAIATRLNDRKTVWVSAHDNAKNGDGRSATYINWGVTSAIIAGHYAAKG